MSNPTHFQEPLPTYETEEHAQTPVICLGMTFADDEARRAYFLERLREHLQDPEFRKIEGFPIGADEDILALSDPPYYTACPNPFLPEIITEWRQDRAETRAKLGLPDDGANVENSQSAIRNPKYHREPFAADVSEGKNNPIYNAHSYHTKVPHKAIMRYILHYTDPGDIVFDGFAGTGMTGVAAQLCGDRKAVGELDYQVDEDGVIYEGSQAISRLGGRKAVLNDLSPAASFIAYNYNTPVDVAAFEREAQRILDEVEEELGWMYETLDLDGKTKRRIDYTVWSEVFACPVCGGEIVFVQEALDPETMRVRDEFPCPSCGSLLHKRMLDKVYVTEYDEAVGEIRRNLKRQPVLVEYKSGRHKQRHPIRDFDRTLLEKVVAMGTPFEFPHTRIPYMHMTHQRAKMETYGVTHIHHFFLSRARHALPALWTKAKAVEDARLRTMLLFTFEQAIWGMSLLERYVPTHFSQVNQYLNGVYYIASQIAEVSPWYILDGKTKRLTKAFAGLQTGTGATAITTESTTALRLPTDSVDYIFTDPPFGENIYYADLNFLVESWHGVLTNSQPEAIVDKAKKKSLVDYQDLMRDCFRRYYEALKPGRWMTVEFHNSHDRVWRAIQEALLSVGFVVADVRTLDKQQASYRQVTAPSAAKQDLVISAYKPNNNLEERFQLQAGHTAGAWDFIRYHLGQLPVAVLQNGVLETIAERQDYLLFDRMVAFHIQRGATVPLSAAEFYAGLREKFVERDGMFFLPEQAPAYDRARLQADKVGQLTLFVNDEKSAIQWLRQLLDPAQGGQPQTYQEIQPQFLRQLHQARHEALPELGELLEQNFLQDESDRWYTPDPNKASDLEALRQKALLREFNRYREGRKKLKQFRTEAVRAGFAHAWRRRDYATIIQVAECLPERVLQEEPDLLMYYDNAGLRVE